MNRQVFKYVFKPGVLFDDVVVTLGLATTATEIIEGEPPVRLYAGCATDAGKRAVVIDASSPTGKSLAEIFTGFASREHGRDAFTVELVERPLGAAS